MVHCPLSWLVLMVWLDCCVWADRYLVCGGLYADGLTWFLRMGWQILYQKLWLTFLLHMVANDWTSVAHKSLKNIKHLITGPNGNSEFCFPETLNVSWGESDGNIKFKGKRNSLLPVGPVFCYTSRLKNRKKLWRNRLLDAGWLTNLLRFQGACPDHMRVKSSSCCFPRWLKTHLSWDV